MNLRAIAFCALAITLAGSLAFATPDASGPAAPPVAALPRGAEGTLLEYGRNIVHDTSRYLAANTRVGMSCEACHIDAGTKAHGGSFRGIYAKFPQWNKRAKRFITLQDRLAECFLYSMNGTPPAYASREMVALTAYIAYLSRGAAVGVGFSGQGLIDFKPERAPSVAAGSKIYGAQCSACHGAAGQGAAIYPPLWGAKSFNAGAGMHRITTMAAFVRYNMPYGAPPNTLTKQEAYDVSAYILSHKRPLFDAARSIAFPAQNAATF